MVGLGGAEKLEGDRSSVTTLKDRLKKMIQASGPISVATYMDLCLHDRRHGYYATRPGLGRDFITAPEISQIFGELIGLWAVHEWQVLGAPERITLVEIGPGRGTLMADVMRAAATVPGFSKAIRLHFIEPSAVLQARLTEQFSHLAPVFLDSIEDIPTDAPVLMIANEWLDCLPVQQLIRVGEVWHERVIGLNDQDVLAFGLNADALPQDIEPDPSSRAIEIQPGLKTLADGLQALLSETTGRALLIDYGPAAERPGDTLRSYKDGQQIDPLSAPGESDLTCDVDFGRLRKLLTEREMSVHGPVSQSAFLLRLGAEARLNQLAKAHPDQADDLFDGIRKLTDPLVMGERFQAVCVSSPTLPKPAGF